MTRVTRAFFRFAFLSCSLFAANGCDRHASRIENAKQSLTVSPKTLSNVNTVNIPHTGVKWQSIGNCWAYSALGWVESMMLRDSSLNQPNFSETYVTYRHYELQLLEGISEELQTGGSFREAAYLINRFGLINEGDFILDEANLSKSDRQKKATAYLNESLKTGLLSRSREPKIIRAELDKAFGIQLEAVQDKIIPASAISISSGQGEFAPLNRVMSSWREVRWASTVFDYPANDVSNPVPKWSGKLNESQTRLLRRVMRALNAKYPVVIDWFVDFRAMNNDGVFSLEKLQQSQIPARQGYHSTVLEDYIAAGFDPVTNAPFETPEGDVSDELKGLAMRFGSVKAFIVKNSWGGSERLDRPSYSVDGERGYHKLSIDYLAAYLPEFEEKTSEFQGYTTGISAFILPPGF